MSERQVFFVPFHLSVSPNPLTFHIYDENKVSFKTIAALSSPQKSIEEILKDDPMWKRLEHLFTMEHESFVIAPKIPYVFEKCKCSIEEYIYSGPGFFFTLDQDGKYVRCGSIKNIQEYIKTLKPGPRDSYMNISVAWWSDDRGYRNMKSFKQKFKRCIN